MNKAKLSEYTLMICSFLVCFILGILLFAFAVHELSHAAAILVFGLRLNSFSLFAVNFDKSPNALINAIVYLSGGCGQAVTAYITFWFASWQEKKIKNNFFSKILKGSKLAFLTIAMVGIFNAILEGFFNDTYIVLNRNLLFVAILTLASFIISFLLLAKGSFSTYRRNQIKGQIPLP